MKSTWKSISALVLLAIAFSCTTTIDPTPQFAKSTTTFAVTTSSSAIAAASSDSLNTVLNVNWNDPKFSLGLENSKFVVVMGVTGSNFTSFVTKSFSGVLTGALTGKDVNGMALKLGGAIGQPISLDLKVVASQGNNNESKESNILTISVTPYGDLTLKASSLTVVCTAAKATKPGDTLTWNAGFSGFNGVKTYQLQYAKGGTNFATPTTVSVSSLSKTFTVRELNLLAQALGIAATTTGDVDFRIKATNELGTVLYSNTVTVTVTTYVAYNSIGIIGDFTGWGNDVDLYRPDAVNAPGNWTVTLYLSTGGVKFRADDGWNDNWGDSAFPSGTGAPGGSNIPISTAGYYKVDFNSVTDAYTFTALSPATYTNISLIGAFNGWAADVDLSVDASGHIWTGTLSLGADSNLKLRADHGWTTAWGGSSIPSGYASTTGGDMSVPKGNYFVYFNDVSGELIFGNTDNNLASGTPYNQISLIGDFNSWSSDAYLIKNPTDPYKWSGKITMDFGAGGSGGAKFRANSAWTTAWGGSTFPNGTGSTSGGNISATSGTYQVTFNSATGEYTFSN
jgi:hypothetical protein